MLLSTLLFPVIIDGPYLHSFCLWDYHSPLPSPKPPDRRDGEITLSLGSPKVIICVEFIEWELCELAVTATSTVESHTLRVWAQKHEVKLFCDCSFMLLECVMCYWEGPPEGGRRRLASNQTLSSSPFIFFFVLFWFSVSMYLLHASTHIQIS